VALIAAVPLCAHAAGASADVAEELRAEYRVLSTSFAEAAPGWRPKAPASGSLLFIAPDQYSPAGQAGDPYRDHRNKYANSLFELAKKAAAARQPSLAFQWATETLRENPDHADARRVLGYESVAAGNGPWLTPYGAKMLDTGKTWHPEFGWVAAADITRYEKGERLIGNRWTRAASDAARHADMKNGWQVRTDHFQVTTNHSLEAAAELAGRLERLHQIWRQLFAAFYLSEREVAQLFAGDRASRTQARPFRVFYHRNRQQYANALRRRQPRIDETLGIYFDTNREAHFFASDDVAADHPSGGARSAAVSATADPAIATLNHEAVHQLFQESKSAAKHIGAMANFWVVEGVATYFETLTEHLDPQAGLYFTIGESTAGRLPAARDRLNDEFYIPLAELTRMGKSDIQRHAELAKLYSQSTGLAAFLIDGDGGRLREPLVRYLQAVYAGRDDAETLPQESGNSYAELDVAYRHFMESLP
jgi:hypothetical protein